MKGIDGELPTMALMRALGWRLGVVVLPVVRALAMMDVWSGMSAADGRCQQRCAHDNEGSATRRTDVAIVEQSRLVRNANECD